MSTTAQLDTDINDPADKWAVREHVEKEQAEEIARLTGALTQANERVEEKQQAYERCAEQLAAVTDELKTTRKLLADANRGAERNARINRSQAGKINEMTAQLAAAEKRLAELEWRPVSVKPTREDADALGYVIGLFDDGGTARQSWDIPFLATATHWRPFSPPPAPTAEEAERKDFEGFFQNDVSSFFRLPSGEYKDPNAALLWGGWQARASKEAQP